MDRSGIFEHFEVDQNDFTTSQVEYVTWLFPSKWIKISLDLKTFFDKNFQILIRSGGDFHRLFSLKVKVIDENDSAPDFRNQISENMNLNFCRASLVRGINADLFDATDKDEKQKLSVTMEGEISEFVTIYKTEGKRFSKIIIFEFEMKTQILCQNDLKWLRKWPSIFY